MNVWAENDDVEYRTCGNSGLRLSALGIGSWAFGGGEYWGKQSQADVNAVCRAAVDAGVNYFDTAEAYNDGRSEESLGEALAGIPRDRLVIGTKISPANAAPKALVQHCEASLKRLRTDYVDLYMIHWPIAPHSIRHFNSDAAVVSHPARVEDAAAALLQLQRQGKVRHLGVSNFGVARIREIQRAGVSVAANELMYSLLARAIEWEILPFCRERGVGVVAYMPLMQGLLTGKYRTLAEVPPRQRRTRHFNAKAPGTLCRHGEEGAEAETQQAVEAIRRLADEKGLTMADLAISWALAGQGISAVIVGCRNVRQLQDNLRSAAFTLDAAMARGLSDVTEVLKQTLGPSFDYYENPRDDRTR